MVSNSEIFDCIIRPVYDADLNLLLVFDALMLEQHVGRAARRLHRSQPAVSQALARLRDLFGDPLFTRHARGLTATARAKQLWAEIQPPCNA
jgi:DNA-binding transcriptional LysR family regulator